LKLKKLIKRVRNHKYGSGTTFYYKSRDVIDIRYIVKYMYEDVADIHSLQLMELEIDKSGKQKVIHESDMSSSWILNEDVRFYLKDYVSPKKEK